MWVICVSHTCSRFIAHIVAVTLTREGLALQELPQCGGCQQPMLPEHHHHFYRLQVLLSSVVECWDKLRETSISVLMSLETPLPGIDDPAAVEDLVQWACKLVGSPRVRESDAGTTYLPRHR